MKDSIVSYKERGSYGNNKFRGNCSGFLIKDLIEHYQAKTILDVMAGSYTTKDICKELGLECDCFDLKEGFNALTDKLPPKKYDLISLSTPIT